MSSTDLFKRPGVDVGAREIFKQYRIGNTTYLVLNGISENFPSGEVSVIQGPSGCGKTTFLNMLGGIDTPDAGQVLIEERPQQMIEVDLSRFRLYDVGFIFQAFNLIPGLAALDNLQLPMTVAGKKHQERLERGRALLELVGMRDKALKRPDELSGGEQQRVAIAVALVNDPPLILADEPTGNLDTRNGMIVADLLCSLAHDHRKTVIICTHDPAIAAKGDRIIHMRDGVFVSDGGAPLAPH